MNAALTLTNQHSAPGARLAFTKKVGRGCRRSLTKIAGVSTPGGADPQSRHANHPQRERHPTPPQRPNNPDPEGITAISRWLREQSDRYHRKEYNKFPDPEGIAAPSGCP